MWGKVKEFFSATEEDLREAQAEADKYMRLAEEAEKNGDKRLVEKYEYKFMKAMNEIKQIEKELYY
jgi:hypothetical protein